MEYSLEKCKIRLKEEDSMYRYIYNDLVEWKNSSYRKPLILNGARQTGKTWILNEFGKKNIKM